MFRNYVLAPAVWHAQPIEFDWDIDRGELRGRDAQHLNELIAKIVAHGEFVSHPYPTSYKITNPLRRLDEMAVILGWYWKLSDDLAAAYPKTEEDDLIYEIDKDGREKVFEQQPIE